MLNKLLAFFAVVTQGAGPSSGESLREDDSNELREDDSLCIQETLIP